MKSIIIAMVVLLAGVVFFLSSCSAQEEVQFRKIENYFETVHHRTLTNDINKVVVISESNGCGACEAAFAQAALEYLADSAVFLITAKGSVVDIEPFKKLKQNCFFDWQSDLSDLSLDRSRIIYFSNNRIDTVIVINIKEFVEQMEFIRKMYTQTEMNCERSSSTGLFKMIVIAGLTRNPLKIKPDYKGIAGQARNDGSSFLTFATLFCLLLFLQISFV